LGHFRERPVARRAAGLVYGIVYSIILHQSPDEQMLVAAQVGLLPMNQTTQSSALEPLADDSSDDELFAALSAASAGFGVAAGGRTTSGTFLPGPVASSSSLWSSSDEDENGHGDGESWIGRTPRTPSTPKMVGRFLIGAKIGEGAYASVREGLNMDTLRIVAVKIVDMRRLRKVRGGVENVKLEVRAQKALKRHPNIIELMGVQEDVSKAKMYIFLEMANGCTLQELLEAAPKKCLPSSQVAFFVNQTLVGLLYMHRRGVVHRDIKPSNLMLTASGELKIADFGVAEFLDKYEIEDSVTRTTGSPAFQAPEIANGEDGYSGMKVDVWAVGISAYFLLVGRIPFEGETLVALFNAIAEGKYDEPSELDEMARDALRKMLEVDWHKRIGVEELLKHPWISRASRLLPLSKQVEEGWVPIPCKQFTVLDLAQRLMDESKPSESVSLPATTSTDIGRAEEKSIVNGNDASMQAASAATATVKSGRAPFVIEQGDQRVVLQPHVATAMDTPPATSPNTGHGQCSII
jgi:serine/threonine protein kinase